MIENSTEEPVIMSDVPLKRCTKCDKEKPATTEFFYREKYNKDGLKGSCKKCVEEYRNRPERKVRDRATQQALRSRPEVQARQRAKRQEYYSRPEIKERRKAYRRRPEQKEYGRSYAQEYRRSHPEAMKAYRKRPETKAREYVYQQEYRRSHPETKVRDRAYAQEYHRRPEVQTREYIWRQEYYHRPEVQARQQAWHRLPEARAHRQEYHRRPEIRQRWRAHKHTRRARERGAEGYWTPQDIQNILKGQRGKCAECKKKLEKYHIDHIVPLTRDGSNWPYNLQLLCPTCNLKKGNKLPHEFYESGQMRLFS